MPSPLSWGIGRAATLLKTLLQYYGKSSEALPGVAYPGLRDNRSTLDTKTGYLKKIITIMITSVTGAKQVVFALKTDGDTTTDNLLWPLATR